MKRIKHFSMSIALLLVLVITLGIGTAYAWFTDTKSGSGSVQFGKIEIDVTSNGSALTNKTFDKTNLLPGDSILDYDVIANKTTDSQPFYFRVELSFSVDDSISTYADTLNSLLTAENIGDGSNFVKDTSVTDKAVFYYGTADALTEVTTTDNIVILDKTKFTVPSTLTQLTGAAQYNKTVSLSVTVVALQSANMTATIAGFKSVNFSSNTSSSGTYEISEDGKYMLFGSYPQTLKADNVTVGTTPDSNGYYTGSDGEKYAKLTAKMYGTDSQYKAGDGTTMTTGTEYYFKVEPLKWRILSNDGSTALIVCDSVIQAMAYQPNYTSSGSYYYVKGDDGNILTDEDGNQIYANNYKYSQLHSWLNGTFLDSAFTSGEQSLIQITTVDNSLESTGNSSNSYVCENTNDKVFALSRADVLNTDYGFSSSTSEHSSRYWYGTDYAKATYLWVSSTSPHVGTTELWLRSPGPTGSYSAYGVLGGHAGNGDNVYYAYIGVAPALQISL